MVEIDASNSENYPSPSFRQDTEVDPDLQTLVMQVPHHPLRDGNGDNTSVGTLLVRAFTPDLYQTR